MSLELTVKQSANLSQRMIQSVQILQMTAQELESYVDELALENPAMDVEKPSIESIDAYHRAVAARNDRRYLTLRQNNDDDYDPKDNWAFSSDHGETLREHLLSQLDLKSFSKMEAVILDYLLDSLDERGYLTESAADTAELLGVAAEDVERVIRRLQKLEPLGICARNLSECLCLQLEAYDQLDDTLTRLLDECLEMVAKNKIAAIAGKLEISAAKATQYCALIRSLNPKPGGCYYHQEEIGYITPDVSVVTESGQYFIILNNADIPTISVNGYYQKLCGDTADREAHEYLEKKIRQAEWVRQCITQRQITLQHVSEEILRRQKAFFVNGPDHLQSMKLSEVAAALNIHESTVSRAISNKYLQCAYGTFPMQYFFQRKATARDTRSTASSDQNHTSTEIKRLLREIIQSEPSQKPFSDRILCEKLSERGVTISRRTIAKYRDEAGIPDASGRKKRLIAEPPK